MIKRTTEELLKNLESVREKTKDTYYHTGELNVHAMVCDCIRVLKFQKTDGWIPVTGRLPEKGKWVLLTYMWNDELIPLTGYGYRIDAEHFFTISGEENESELLKDFTVTAWMPLPDPYEE